MGHWIFIHGGKLERSENGLKLLHLKRLRTVFLKKELYRGVDVIVVAHLADLHVMDIADFEERDHLATMVQWHHLPMVPEVCSLQATSVQKQDGFRGNLDLTAMAA
jgi:hypothetical protein